MYTKAVNKIMQFMEWICMAFLAAAVVIIAVQVFWRYVLGSPLAWTEEISRYVFIWIVMLGIPIMFNRDIAICFDLFSGKLHGRKSDYLQIFFRVWGLYFCVVYLCFSISLCMKTGMRKTSGIEIPLNVLYAAQPVSALLTGMVMIKQIIGLAKKGGASKC